MAEIKTEIGDPIGGYCKYCNGSGESSTLSGGGPDAYEVPINCPKCDGTGERRVLTDTQIENMFFGEIDNRTLSFARAIEAAVLSANAGKVDAKPTAWVRFTSDGGYEGPIMDSSSRMDGVRRSVWTPLYAYIPSEQNIYQRYYATSNAWSDIPKDQYDYLLATYGENITLRIVYAAPSQQQAIDAGRQG